MPGQQGFQHGGLLPMGVFPIRGDARCNGGFDLAGRPAARCEQQTHRRGSVGDAQLAHGLLDVAVHRLGRDLELPPDVLGRPMP